MDFDAWRFVDRAVCHAALHRLHRILYRPNLPPSAGTPPFRYPAAQRLAGSRRRLLTIIVSALGPLPSGPSTLTIGAYFQAVTDARSQLSGSSLRSNTGETM